MSTARTFWPSLASEDARLIVVVVLPTPPFWLATARSRLIRLIDQFLSGLWGLREEDRESLASGQSEMFHGEQYSCLTSQCPKMSRKLVDQWCIGLMHHIM